MNLSINERESECFTGERLIDAARRNKSHIGYFCGGNGICQTCYVKVLEGMERLSPVSEKEKTFLSDKLLYEGYRVACMTTIEKPGAIEVLTTVEEVRRMFLHDPLQLLVAYPAKMGWESAVKLGDTLSMQVERVLDGKLDVLAIFKDVMGAVGDAVSMTLTGLREEKNETVSGPCSKEQHLFSCKERRFPALVCDGPVKEKRDEKKSALRASIPKETAAVG